METDRTRARRDSIRKARRMSNWTAAAPSQRVATGDEAIAVAERDALGTSAWVVGAESLDPGEYYGRQVRAGPIATSKSASPNNTLVWETALVFVIRTAAACGKESIRTQKLKLQGNPPVR